MSGFLISGLGSGQPLYPARNSQSPNDASTSGGVSSSDNTGTGEPTTDAGDSGTVNDTSATQSVSAPSTTAGPSGTSAATTANSTTTGKEAAPESTTKSVDRADLVQTSNGFERAQAEQATTKLFFDSLLSSISSTPNVADIGLAEKAEPEKAEKSDSYTSAEATVARDRFMEGLKLVNEPV